MDAYMDIDAVDLGNVMGSNLPSSNTQQTTTNDVPCNMEVAVIETAHDSDTEDEDFSPGNKRRGNNKPNWARRGSVEILKFNNQGQAVEPNETVARWQQYLGLMVKDHTLFGLDVFDWRTFRKTKVLDEAWCRIKRRASANKRNRAKKRMSHTTGTKTFAQVRNQYKIEHEGADPNRCTMFELTHTRSDGKPVDKESEKAIMDMRQKISTIKNAKRASHLPEIITNIEISEVYASVLGKEKHGAIRGFGIGVRLDDVPDVLVEKRGAQLEVQALREEHEAKLDHIRKESQEREAKLRDEMNKQEMATTDRMKRLEMQLLNQQAMFERFFSAGLLPNIVPISQNGAANLNFPTGMGTHKSLQTSSVDAFETPHHVPISPSTLQKNTPHFNEVYRPQPPTPAPRHQDSLCSEFSTLG